jgi:L-arabinokinase
MVRAATLHPINEHPRVQQLVQSLPTATSAAELRELGALMFASHDGYSACGLGSEGTDRLVAAVRREGPENGLFGAKISGGGRGGTVAVLARSDALGRARALAEAYASATGRAARLFAGSSPGALAVPVLRKKL